MVIFITSLIAIVFRTRTTTPRPHHLRLWLLNNPQSGLAAKMDYYIAPEEPETDFLKITKPEEIRICDPAAGSGHMLTYAFDLLYAIYEEEGYDATEIPALILTHNLTGVEIDDRAGALAAFALAMKAAGKLGRRRFLRMEAQPDICVLQNVSFTPAEMQDVAAVVGKDLFTDELRETLGQFEQAKNFGSLIMPKLRDPAETLRVVEARDFGGDLLLRSVQERVIAVLRMAEALSPKYHVVVANPPYAGAKGLNPPLKSWLEKVFPDAKSDLMTAFMVRSSVLSRDNGTWGMINLPSWMFLSSFKDCRSWLISTQTISSLLQLGRGIFGADFGSVAFIIDNKPHTSNSVGSYRRLFEKHVQVRRPEDIETLFKDRDYGSFSFRQVDLKKIPGYPIAYWISEKFARAFEIADPISDTISLRAGLSTGDNPTFQRNWHELSKADFDTTRKFGTESPAKWFPCHSGGEFRKWYGNHEVALNWAENGQAIKTFGADEGRVRSAVRNEDYYFREGVTWSKVSSGSFAARFRPEGFLFDDTGRCGFTDKHDVLMGGLGMFCSKVTDKMLEVLCPTMSFTSTELGAVPLDGEQSATTNSQLVENLVAMGKSDWDAYETSWDFTTLPLLASDHRGETLADSYATLRAHWQSMTDEMQALEEENNRIFIDAYGLQDELTPEVPIEEITLTCNPAYRYGVKGSAEANEARLRADTMAEFLSYAVGCMFGRYSLNAPGLILANQGERLEDYLSRVPEPTFMPDADNVIPVLDGDWFADDITERFRLFLRTTFGEAHFQENLRYIGDALGKDIRRYFTKDFYADHVKRYKKRPIYWMFSSPKGTFNALIYMHRYRPDTVSVLLNDYLREFISKLEGERGRLEKLSDDPSASQGQRTKALKDMAVIAKQIDELNEWERDVVFPLAQAKIEIDLDDGVKANYPKFGEALKKIPRLEAKDD